MCLMKRLRLCVQCLRICMPAPKRGSTYHSWPPGGVPLYLSWPPRGVLLYLSWLPESGSIVPQLAPKRGSNVSQLGPQEGFQSIPVRPPRGVPMYPSWGFHCTPVLSETQSGIFTKKRARFSVCCLACTHQWHKPSTLEPLSGEGAGYDHMILAACSGTW